MVPFSHETDAPEDSGTDLPTANEWRHSVVRYRVTFKSLGAEISERKGSRVAVVLYGEERVFHRPHPSPNTVKGAVASIRKWFEFYEVRP